MSVLKTLQLNVIFTKPMGPAFIQGSLQMFIELYKIILYLSLLPSPKIYLFLLFKTLLMFQNPN